MRLIVFSSIAINPIICYKAPMLIADQPTMLALMLITQKGNTPLDRYLQFIENCIHNGVSSVQLREKSYSEAALVNFGQALLECLKPKGIPLIVNDFVPLAKRLNADGVHLGQADGCPARARQYLGLQSIIGLSVSTLSEVHASQKPYLDYLGVGPIFHTQNKPDATTHCGLKNLANIVNQSELPCIAIGGINTKNITQVHATKVKGVAVIGALHHTHDIPAVCQQLLPPYGDSQ